jgi:hypothetical protein
MGFAVVLGGIILTGAVAKAIRRVRCGAASAHTPENSVRAGLRNNKRPSGLIEYARTFPAAVTILK